MPNDAEPPLTTVKPGPATAPSASPPRLSVVVPAYKAVGTLEKCLTSLRDQSARATDYEVVVVLNGPDDGTPALARAVADGDPSGRYRLLESDATSAGAARNAGVAAARGAYTTFVDSDDWVSDRYVELLLASAHPDRIAVASLDDVAADGTVNQETSFNKSLRSRPANLVPAQLSPVIAALNACKAYPTAWLRSTPYVEALRSGEDVVLAGQLFAPYQRQFVLIDLTPARSGATYYRRIVEGSVSRQALSFDFAVTQRLAAITAMTQGTQHDPADRTVLVRSLIDAQFGFVRRYMAANAQDRDRVRDAIRAAGVPGVTAESALATASGGFDLFRARPAGVPGVVIAAASARTINQHARLLAYLARRGVSVRLVHVTEQLSPALRRLPGSTRVDLLPEMPAWLEKPAPKSRPRRAVRKIARRGWSLSRRVVPDLLPSALAGRLALRADPDVGRPLQRASDAYALDRAGASILEAYGVTNICTDDPVISLSALALRLAAGTAQVGRNDALAIRDAAIAARGSVPPPDAEPAPDAEPVPDAKPAPDAESTPTTVAEPGAAPAIAPAVAPTPPGSDLGLFPGLWAMAAYHCIRSVRLNAAQVILDEAAGQFADTPEWHADGLRAVQALLQIAKGEAVADLQVTATRTLEEADRALAGSDLDRALFLTTVGLELLFTPLLHTAVARSSLVDDPAGHLLPLASSEVGQLLRALARPSYARTPQPGRRSPSVTVLPGAYPKSAEAVIAALEPAADVRVLDLSARESRFGTIGVEQTTVREQLLAGLGQPPTVDFTTREALSSDVIFVDWADKGLAWLTRAAPAGTRIVARLHGVDTLSLWMHTVDWSRVSDAIFPSEHVRRATSALLGDRLTGVRTHVVPEPIDVARYVVPKDPAAATTLGMVGWAQRVKDPGWTLDVLERLRSADPRWRLLLIGADFPTTPNRVESEHAAAFRARVLQPKLAEAVEYVGHTASLPVHLARVGWGLSASLRESFDVGLHELAASGAVPVVRDWPVYARVGGARTLFPPEWVVDTPEQATARILEISESGGWAAASAAAHEVVADRIADADPTERLRQIVLG